MAFTELDRGFMRRALELAEEARGTAEPNPLVGALLVRDGEVVGEGCTRPYGGPHAELVALQQAGDRAEGATIYVTLEPCAHWGKTPPCAPAVAEAGVARVVAAVLDPTPKTRGQGVELLTDRGVEVQTGLLRAEAVRCNAGFFKLAAVRRPLVIAKWAMSADGKIATRTGDSRWISSEPSRHRVHAVRGRVDCVAVGARTARMDDPLLTCRDAEAKRTAHRLVVCGGSAPDTESRLLRSLDRGPVLLAYPEGSPPDGLQRAEQAGCEALPLPEGDAPGLLDLGALLDQLGHREMTNVLLEGGANLLGGFFDAGLVDRVMAFVAPLVLGGEAAPSGVGGAGSARVEQAKQLGEPRMQRSGPDVLLEGWVRDPVRWLPKEE
ncbi:MAG: bifunctional diaminohydroxyphosphoribosylaminopyrimidine deaminase/5-amino-6-(5-phosphoribosylamino)uracil reductase RibD [Planctomycetota bacterium]